MTKRGFCLCVISDGRVRSRLGNVMGANAVNTVRGTRKKVLTMELKPCPFCGGCAELRESREEMPFSEECNRFYVICKKCGCSPFYFSEVNLYYKKDYVERAENLREKAIEAWNRRVDSGDVAPVRHGRWN